MARNSRQSKILEIISQNEIETQEELVDALRKAEFDVTQATISRDIKELGLIKTAGKSKKYRYARVFDKQGDTNKLLELFKVAVVNITCAQNLIVVKTLTGNASAVAATIDSQDIPEILGTLAGDDTVLVIASSNEAANAVVASLHALLV